MGRRHEAADAGYSGPSDGPELTQQELWSRIWSHAVYDLQIPEERVWRMTLREIGLLTGRFEHRQQREDLLVGILAASTANWGFRAPQDTMLQPWDFVPSLKPPPEEEESDEAVCAHINAVLMAASRPGRATA